MRGLTCRSIQVTVILECLRLDLDGVSLDPLIEVAADEARAPVQPAQPAGTRTKCDDVFRAAICNRFRS